MKNNSNGHILLIPTVISEDTLMQIPRGTISLIHETTHFVVERSRTARRFIKTTNPPYEISSLHIIEIDQEDHDYINKALNWLQQGHNVGVISESGMPGVADPGSAFVIKAHSKGFTVKPLVGPSSIFLSLAASGLNGQNFCFNGYLPIKENELKSKLKQLELIILKTRQTQIFIETPYRNDRMLKFLVKNLNPNIKLCVARDITGEEEFIITRRVSDWKNLDFQIGKIPTIFLIG
jgi:16S rRNA (cytidine1402-2'-O)-methyltransferase